MKKLILSVLGLLMAVSNYAYDFEKDGFYYNITSLGDLTAQLTCSGLESEYGNNTATYSGDIIVPKTVEYSGKTFTVTSINGYAFINCSIGTLTIPETIIETDKTSYVDGNPTMGLYGTFQKLIIEDSKTPIRCFRAIINGNVTESVYLGRQIEGEQEGQIVYNSDRKNSYTEIEFGENVTSLHMTCYGNTSLTSVKLPATIKSLDRAFNGCMALKIVDAPGVEETMGAFNGCTSLESVNLPMLRLMSDGTFEDCTSLKSVALPNSLLTIGNSYNNGTDFVGCSSLESIVIPSSVVIIGNTWGYGNPKTFTECSSLKTITMCNPLPIELEESNFDTMTYLTATLKVPVGAAEAYRHAKVWKNFANIEEDASISDDIFTITQKSIYDGSIEMEMNEALPSYDTTYDKYRFAKKGETMTVRVMPNRNYKLVSLTINGMDVTADVQDNVYQTTITGSMVVSAAFEYDETAASEPMFLTIKQAENGSVKMSVREWDSYMFYIEPSDGWKLHTVTFNGEDITSSVEADGRLTTPRIMESSVLSVSFEEDTSGVADTQSSNAKVYVQGNSIVIANAEVGESIQVYNEAGVNVASTQARQSVETVTVEKGHVYIVKLKNKTIKVAI